MVRVLVLTSLVAACSYNFSYNNTHYRCTTNADCPSGQSCVAGVCGGGASGDGGPTNDGNGTIDAPPDGSMMAGACGKLAMLHDDFTSVTPFWIPWTDGGPSTVVTGGHLAVTIPSGSADLWAGYDSYFRYDMTETEMDVTVSQLGGVDTVVEIRDPTSARAQLTFEAGKLYAVLPSGGGTKASAPYSSTNMRHLRFRETAGTLYWEYSPDGTTWTELYHQADPIQMDNVMAVLAAGGELASASEAHFDEINTALPAMSACAATTLVDDFGGAFAPHFFSWNDTGATASVSGGDAIVSTNGVTNVWGGFQSAHAFNLVSSSVFYDMTRAPQASPFVTFAQVCVPQDSNTRFEMNVDGSTLEFVQRVASTNVNVQTLPYDPVQHRYWRFRVASNTVYYDTSPDASTWTNRESFPLMLDASQMQILGGAGEYGATSANNAHIGGINTP